MAKTKYRNFAKRLLAVSLCCLMMVLAVPVFAETSGESDQFNSSNFFSNHWGCSDLRAYLNSVEKKKNKKGEYLMPVDSTESSTNKANYPSYFSNKEYALVKPFTYVTEIADSFDEAIMPHYETTDKFWLPSGNSLAGLRYVS